jgi:hypothetical protein
MAGGALAALVAAAPFARAGDEAAAVELFEEGKAAATRHQWAVACPKFAESYRLLPRVGSVLNLADCEEQTGRLAEARAHWQQGRDLARAAGDERAALAARRLAQLDARVPRLTLRLAADAPAGTTVARDGVEVGAPSLGVALPIDPGPHTVTVSAPGRATRTEQVSLREGESKALSLEPGEPLAQGAQGAQGTPVTPVAPAGAETATTSSPWSGQRTLALVLGGAGVVGVGLGAYFGVTTLAKKNEAGTHCDPDLACDATGVQLLHDAHVDGNVSTVAFVAGGAALAAGAVLWLMAPGSGGTTDDRITARLGVGPSGVVLRGAW